ncbi:unnamed protein product, partial [Didymodactylos carnosus]
LNKIANPTDCCHTRKSLDVATDENDKYLANDTFNDFLVWQQSCWLAVPLESCSCPVGMKVYSCKPSVGLAILFNLYQVSDKTRIQSLGKRKAKGRPKKVSIALNL